MNDAKRTEAGAIGVDDSEEQLTARARDPLLIEMVRDIRGPRDTTLFAAPDPAAGKVIGQLHRPHRSKKFLAFLHTGDARVPA